jgi:hypothetical protein
MFLTLAAADLRIRQIFQGTFTFSSVQDYLHNRPFRLPPNSSMRALYW